MPQPIVIVTRPEPGGTIFANALPQTVQAIVSPLIRIEHLPIQLKEQPAGLVLTSQHAAKAVDDIGPAKDIPIFCVGDRTAAAVRAAGYEARSASANANGLVEMILAAKPRAPLLHLRGEHTRGDVADRLTLAGVKCVEQVVYEQVATKLSETALSALTGENPVILPLFSPRTVSILSEQGPFSAPAHVVAISEEVAREAKCLKPADVAIATAPNSKAMQSATSRLIAEWGGGAA